MSTLICPKCKCQTEGNELFCSKCGTKLDQSQSDNACSSEETHHNQSFLRRLKDLPTSVKLMIATKLITLTIETGLNPTVALIFGFTAIGLVYLYFTRKLHSEKSYKIWKVILKATIPIGLCLWQKDPLYFWTDMISYVIIFILPLTTLDRLHQLWATHWSHSYAVCQDNHGNKCEIIEAEIVDDSDEENGDHQLQS